MPLQRTARREMKPHNRADNAEARAAAAAIASAEYEEYLGGKDADRENFHATYVARNEVYAEVREQVRETGRLTRAARREANIARHPSFARIELGDPEELKERLLARAADKARAREVRRAAYFADRAAAHVERDRVLAARRMLRALPSPETAVVRRWVRLDRTRVEIGNVPFEVELSLRLVDRAVDATMSARTRGPELAAALTLAVAPVLRGIPALAQAEGGQLVEPLARIASALEAEPEVLAQAMYDDSFAEDTEAVRQRLRTNQPVVIDPTPTS